MDAEIVRHAVLECLVNRHPAALPLHGILRRVKLGVDGPVTDTEALSALEMLTDLGLVKSQFDELGSSRWWQATAQGMTKVERQG